MYVVVEKQAINAELKRAKEIVLVVKGVVVQVFGCGFFWGSAVRRDVEIERRILKGKRRVAKAEVQVIVSRGHVRCKAGAKLGSGKEAT
jgi:hypothetical protein